MKPYNFRMFLGIMLVLVGGLALLNALHILSIVGDIWGVIFALLFIMGGASFLYVLATNQSAWWAAIPGCTLVGIGVLIGLPMVVYVPGEMLGAIFMASISLGFWLVYIVERRNWWAIIPAGCILSIALMIALTPLGAGISLAAMFWGFAATFVLVRFLPGVPIKTDWAWIPALILFITGIFFLFLQGELAAVVAPIALILAGVALLVRSLLAKRSQA